MHLKIAAISAACAAVSTLLLVIAPVSALAESTIKIASTGFIYNDIKAQDMGDGSNSQIWRSTYVDVATGDLAGTYGGTCLGLGLIAADGTYSGSWRCTTDFSKDDAFTFQCDHQQNDGSCEWVITGGKGKYKGVTGSGKTTFTWGDPLYGVTDLYASEGTLNLP